MAHAHHHLGAEKVVKGEAPAGQLRHERHAADRRAARAARHLHGGAAPHAKGRRHQPAGRNQDDRRDITPDVSQIMLEYTADRRLSVNKQDVTIPSSRNGSERSTNSARIRRCSSAAAGTLRYKDIIEVIDAAKGAGVEKVGIVTDGMRKSSGAAD